MSNDEIRHGILTLLMSEAEKAGEIGLHASLAPNDFVKELRISENALNLNIDYLESKKYIKLIKALGCHFAGAYITALGMDIISNSL